MFDALEIVADFLRFGVKKYGGAANTTNYVYVISWTPVSAIAVHIIAL